MLKTSFSWTCAIFSIFSCNNRSQIQDLEFCLVSFRRSGYKIGYTMIISNELGNKANGDAIFMTLRM
ncbi:hypothetical protein GWI33_007794 [Rhynchophorus ferrugineus]|uniref:Lipoprotein n=1 Tax=Rhynchophorus ferrugineus TaxID=354439 RepID=A0A834IFP5_RHYFE|nr:hypothetical protein GWI33_007794 [Rhynchophorus ferrugineus]